MRKRLWKTLLADRLPETGGKEDRTERAGNLFSGSMMPEMPSYLEISNDGPFHYIHDRKTFIFEGAPQVRIVTDTGLEVFADRAEVDAAADKVFSRATCPFTSMTAERTPAA